MMQVYHMILIMNVPTSLLDHLLLIMPRLLLLLPFDQLTVGFIRHQCRHKLISCQSCITVKIHASNNTQNVFIRSFHIVLSQKRFKILSVDEAIIPIVYFKEGFVVVELFATFNGLFLLLYDSVEGYLFFE